VAAADALGAVVEDAAGDDVAAGACEVAAGACEAAGACVAAGAAVAEGDVADVEPWVAPVADAAGTTDTSDADPEPAVTTVGTSPDAETDNPIWRSTAPFGITTQVRIGLELVAASAAALTSAAGRTMLAHAVGMLTT
jgi:hypothetical protein